MPLWGNILQEVSNSPHVSPARVDVVRRKYLKKLHDHTKRDIILYASNWTQGNIPFVEDASINDEDIQGFMEVMPDLKQTSLDLILHSPGGVAEVTENLVSYMRKEFEHVRVIIPQAAMSAATMLACSADQIVMAKHSSLGPIDPQLVLQNQYGAQMQPAQAIVDNFEKAKQISATSPENLGAYIPILNQYYPGLIEQCHRAQELSKSLVSTWLGQYMYQEKPDAKEKAAKTANSLADHDRFKSHSRHIDKEMAADLGLNVMSLEDDPVLYDLVLSVFHAATITFQHGTVKIIENNLGNAFMKQLRPEPQALPPAQFGVRHPV